MGSWKCSLCQETFNQPALSKKHPCRRSSSAIAFSDFGEEGSYPRRQTDGRLTVSLNKRALAIAGSVLLGLVVILFMVAGFQNSPVSRQDSYQNQVSSLSPTKSRLPSEEANTKPRNNPTSISETEDQKISTYPAPAPSPAENEETFRSNYVKAAEAFSRNDLDSSLSFLKSAEGAKPSQANCANLRGAIYTRKREWKKAQAAFEEALRLQPDLPMAEFNLGEIHFLNEEYEEARARFKTFLHSQPQNDLAQYKVFLCDLFSGKELKANQFLGSLQPSSASPIYYFCHAAHSFMKGNKAEAIDFINSAYRIYPSEANATFADSLVEKGYLQGQSL